MAAYERDLIDQIEQCKLKRESQWTEAVAVGTEAFIKSVTEQVKNRRRWQIEEMAVGKCTGNVLREPTPAYMPFSAPKNAAKIE